MLSHFSTINYFIYLCNTFRKDARVVEWAALEMRCTGNCTGGSNPSLSAKLKHRACTMFFYTYKGYSSLLVIKLIGIKNRRNYDVKFCKDARGKDRDL